MRAADLDLRELLQFDPQGGVIRFGGQRALLFDAVALGLLRKELIETLSATGARGVLTRFGYAHGWRTAENLKEQFPWDDEGEWRRAGGRLHTLQGLVVVEPLARKVESGTEPFAEAIWHDSYEAEQHLLHLGQADEPVCWTLAGFASGYLSYANGRQVYCIEERCRGKGDAVCHIVGRMREDWGEAIAPHLPFYQSACLDEVLAHVTHELKRAEKRLRARQKELGPKTPAATDPSGLVAQSAAMQKVLELARRVAKVDSTVLITGESGVGKERIARFIHDESARLGGPFVAINCGAVPEGLLESELFGHAKGAFTGATQDRPGLFEAASGGTLFLDEIGELPPAMQVKLLRVLQEREVRRVGENRSRAVDVRVLAATHRDLVAEVHAARFRQDLYYRLRVVEIRVPPLRERREDILPLARTLLQAAAKRTRRPVTGLSPRAANQLLRYSWPGNVRELENAMERAVVLAQGSRIDLDDLPEELGLALPAAYVPGDVRSLEDVEREYILAVLRASGGDKVKAARLLKIGTATLYRKLKRWEGTGRPAA
ncbi:MAG: sigma-54-dependent Fis family transcriptional regulator [Myxococcales bacterium]|nr:sigma-54-dependent Fis family transcriptional regulator [Myxococcota bacterium]MDW8283244.1 sigma-54-dependent Fis family transcriptional regulator [Myxococcales bacterium]